MSENQKEPQYKLRWSEELRDKIVESAKTHNRSINAEICTRLEDSFSNTHISDEALTINGQLSMLFFLLYSKCEQVESLDDINDLKVTLKDLKHVRNSIAHLQSNEKLLEATTETLVDIKKAP